jgi:hypothetical protein
LLEAENEDDTDCKQYDHAFNPAALWRGGSTPGKIEIGYADYRNHGRAPDSQLMQRGTRERPNGHGRPPAYRRERADSQRATWAARRRRGWLESPGYPRRRQNNDTKYYTERGRADSFPVSAQKRRLPTLACT